jgi:transposase
MSERLTMRKIQEVLRLKFEQHCGHRAIAASCGIGVATVSEYLKRARESGVEWAEAARMSEAELEARLFPKVPSASTARAPVDFSWVHRELRRTGVTLQLLWSEYVQACSRAGLSAPYQYSQFCARYLEWRARVDVVMRQVHRAGEKAFIDYSGKRPSIIDASTGEARPVELFVMVLGASSYTFAEATRSQKVADFTSSVVRGLEYFAGVPEILVPDQLRSAVSGPDRYDPDINATLLELGRHYGTTIIPARPRKPRDKAKVENAVLVVQRWVLARLRNRQFFNLEELNVAIAELVVELNERAFRKLDGSRRSVFETLERSQLKPLPIRRFVPFQWSKPRVNIDYHVDFDERLYSVPHQLIGERVELRATALTIEIFHGGKRIFSHVRSYGPKGTQVTCEDHRPQSHKDYGKWPPERLVAWARTMGPSVAQVVEMTLAAYPRPEMGYRPVLGILRSAERHGAARFDAACARALAVSGRTAPRRKFIEAILKQHLELAPIATTQTARPLGHHENVRGGAYYDTENKKC